jgi:hypothetical protein
MEYQLRRSRIKPGHMRGFLEAWIGGVYPLRRRFGFSFVGAWVVEGSDEFVWILGYDGPDGFTAADARYYASPERARLAPDPARFFAATDHRMIRGVLPEGV